jgi:hypothetical protein
VQEVEGGAGGGEVGQEGKETTESQQESWAYDAAGMALVHGGSAEGAMVDTYPPEVSG